MTWTVDFWHRGHSLEVWALSLWIRHAVEMLAECPGFTWLVVSEETRGHLTRCHPWESTRARFYCGWWPGNMLFVRLSYIHGWLLTFLWVMGVVLLYLSLYLWLGGDTPCLVGGYPSRPSAALLLPRYTWWCNFWLLSSQWVSDAGASCGPVCGWRVQLRFFQYHTPAPFCQSSRCSLWRWLGAFWRSRFHRFVLPPVWHYPRRPDLHLWRPFLEPILSAVPQKLQRGSEIPVWGEKPLPTITATQLRRGLSDGGCMEIPGWWRPTGRRRAYRDAWETQMGWPTGTIYPGIPGVESLHRILYHISNHRIMQQIIHSIFRTFWSHLLCPRLGVDPHSHVESYVLTHFLRSSSQNCSFSRITFGSHERCSRVLMMGSLSSSPAVSPHRWPLRYICFHFVSVHNITLNYQFDHSVCEKTSCQLWKVSFHPLASFCVDQPPMPNGWESFLDVHQQYASNVAHSPDCMISVDHDCCCMDCQLPFCDSIPAITW